jgi:hypothetical protein
VKIGSAVLIFVVYLYPPAPPKEEENSNSPFGSLVLFSLFALLKKNYMIQSMTGFVCNTAIINQKNHSRINQNSKRFRFECENAFAVPRNGIGFKPNCTETGKRKVDFSSKVLRNKLPTK